MRRHRRKPALDRHLPEGTLERRATFMAFVLGLMSLVLLARLSYLQLVQHNYFAGQALGNQVQARKVPPGAASSPTATAKWLYPTGRGFVSRSFPNRLTTSP